MNTWIDVHTHLNFLETSPEEALALAEEQGVQRVITIGTCPKDLPVVLELAKIHSPKVFCTLGIHPHDAKEFSPDVEKFMVENFPDPRVVAVGETGLDYYYDNSPREVQREAFRRQLELSVEHDLPVQIHSRDAEEDTVKILKEFSGKVRGIIHCFTGTEFLAKEALALGLNISISGVITFKSADELRKVVKEIPLERLHVETDSPFLAPVPMRGRKNTSAYVVHVARYLAELKQVSEDELADQMRKNALNMFSKIKWA